jgi:hypothetical protein
VLRLRDSFGGRTPSWNRAGVLRIGENFELTVTAGESIEASVPPATDTRGPTETASRRGDRDDGRRTMGRLAASVLHGTVGVFSRDNR